MYTLREVKSFFASVYTRITLSRVTTFFFIFSCIHCFAQGIIQSFVFSLDSHQNTLLSAVVASARLPRFNTTFIEGTRGNLHLQICNDVPHGQLPYPCITVFNSSVDSNARPGLQTRRISPYDSLTILANAESVDPVIIRDGSTGSMTSLSLQCTQNLLHPKQIMTNSKREAVALISLQFWLFAISVLAIVNNSVPHLLTVMASRTLYTAWSIYAVWRTFRDRGVFQDLLAAPGTPCSLDIFTGYFQQREGFVIADMLLATTSFFLFIYLIRALLRDFSSEAFRCIGAPEHINRINKFFLAILACLQLEVFVLTTGMAMWIDILLNTAIAEISEHTPIYKALFFTTTLLLPPWIALGWWSIKNEKKKFFAVFLTVAFIILSGWSIMFYSIVYRWSFLQWPFLGCFTVASLILLLSSLILGGICRSHFGKGHAEYLRAEETLASLNFSREVFSRDNRASTQTQNLPMDAVEGKQSFDSVRYIKTLDIDGTTDYEAYTTNTKGKEASYV